VASSVLSLHLRLMAEQAAVREAQAQSGQQPEEALPALTVQVGSTHLSYSASTTAGTPSWLLAGLLCCECVQLTCLPGKPPLQCVSLQFASPTSCCWLCMGAHTHTHTQPNLTSYCTHTPNPHFLACTNPLTHTGDPHSRFLECTNPLTHTGDPHSRFLACTNPLTHTGDPHSRPTGGR
jgi:hypothetical protein